MNENTRETLNIVVVGHVDHGKSTVIGRLLHDTDSLPDGTVNKVRQIAKETGKPFEYAYLLDAFEEEQKQGITIDTTQIQFQTPKRDYVIIDAPGHKEFLKNMISGAANAEAALLVIDAAEGVQEQSKRHAYLLSLLGIRRTYVVANKMDLVDYSQEVFDRVQAEMERFLEPLDVRPLGYIPVSAFCGDNITGRSPKLSWYRGPSILEAVDRLEKEQDLVEKPLRFPIQDVYKFDNRRIIAGRLESGTLRVGDTVAIYPQGKTTRVKTIEHWAPRDRTDEVTAGRSVGITVEDEFFNKRGEVIATENSAPHLSNTFRASVFWMGREPLSMEKTYKLKLATAQTQCQVEKIFQVVEASTLRVDEEQRREIRLNDVAEVLIGTKEELAYDLFREIGATGRFVILDGYDVAGGGIITGAAALRNGNTGAVFAAGEHEARCEIFEEFYYRYDQLTVNKARTPARRYGRGDALPLVGDSYSYPDFFDILVLRDHMAVQIRNGTVAGVVPLNQYRFGGLPVVNGRGFTVRIRSEQDVKEFLAGYPEDERDLDNDFLEQWITFGLFRQIRLRGNLAEPDYYL